MNNMDYWRGNMNWSLSNDWKCQTCDQQVLVWGLIHAHCRCIMCHTEYHMRDDENKVVNVPICMLKEEYKLPARLGWKHYHTPISHWTDEMWDNAFELVKQNIIDFKSKLNEI